MLCMVRSVYREVNVAWHVCVTATVLLVSGGRRLDRSSPTEMAVPYVL